jgi:hypothetical protein
MFRVKSRPWQDIVNFYRGLTVTPKAQWLLPMLTLVEQIAAADFAGQLYCATSMTQLMVSYLPEFDFHREVLRINSNPKRASLNSNIARLSHLFTNAGEEPVRPMKRFPL